MTTSSHNTACSHHGYDEGGRQPLDAEQASERVDCDVVVSALLVSAPCSGLASTRIVVGAVKPRSTLCVVGAVKPRMTLNTSLSSASRVVDKASCSSKLITLTDMQHSERRQTANSWNGPCLSHSFDVDVMTNSDIR